MAWRDTQWWEYLIPGWNTYRLASNTVQSASDALSSADQAAQDRSAATDLLSGLDTQGAMDTAREQAQGMFGDTGQTAGEWGTQAANVANDFQSFSDWLNNQGMSINDFMVPQNDILQQLQNPDDTAALQREAQAMGFNTPEELASAKQQMYQAMLNPQGLGDQYALRQRQNQANVADAERRAQRLVENSMANTGSTVRMLATADEASRSISNYQMAQDAQLAQDDFEARAAQVQQNSQMYMQMVQTGQMSYSDYMDRQQQGLTAALAGYASQMQQYLGAYGADHQAMVDQFQALTNMATLQLGIDQATLDATQQLYDQQVQPILDKVNALLASSEAGGQGLSDLLDTIIGLAPLVM